MVAKTYKVQAVAAMFDLSADAVRRLYEDAGIEIARQESGPKSRVFTIDNVFELARFRANKKRKAKKWNQVVATVYAPKGGVGKTTLTSNLGASFALQGYKTLLIDLDFQANLTLSMGYDSELTTEEAVEVGLDPSQAVEFHFGHLTPGYPQGRKTLDEVLKKPYGEFGPHLVPADLSLDQLDTVLAFRGMQGKNPEKLIPVMINDGKKGKDKHFDISDYDIVLFDASPSKNQMTQGALLGSDMVISPVSMEKFSTKALSYLSSVLTEMESDFGRHPELVVVSNFFAVNRLRVLKQMAAITETYRDALLEPTIRRSEDFPKNLNEDYDLPLVLAKPVSSASSELREVATALLKRMEILNG